GPHHTPLPTYPFQHQQYWPAEQDDERVGTSESDFWAAVDNEDFAGAAETLLVDDEQAESVRALLPVLSEWRHQQRLRYLFVWRPLPDHGQPTLTGRWLVVVPEPGVAAPDIVGLLRAHGADAELLHIRADGTADLPDGPPPAGVVSLHGLTDADEHAPVARTRRQAVAAAGVAAAGVDAPLWFVTRGAVTADGERPAGAARAAVWGAARAAVAGHASGGGLVDLPAEPAGELDPRLGDRLIGVLSAGRAGGEYAIRPAGVLVRRLVRAATGPATVWRPSGTVLVIGTGPRAAELAGAVRKNGAERVATAAEVPADPQALHRALPPGVPLTAIVYAPEAAPVTDGDALVRCLDALPDGQRPANVVLVSGFTAALGRPDRPADAVEAAVLESIAHRLRADGHPATYVAWHHGDDLPAARPVPVRAAMAAIRRAVGQHSAVAAVVDVDWKAWPDDAAAPVLRDLLGDAPVAQRPAAESQLPLTERLAQMSPPEQEELLRDIFRKRSASILGYGSPEEIDVEETFLDIGFSSFTALELGRELSAQTGLVLSPAVIMDHPTPSSLIRHVRDALSRAAG
ncbi:phosphopantetheine-binding protein, partial [Micromonospora sp. RP3T]|uniref:phosphopantetheine-binding protein n=1 Tax=Micromonospora sp. RP3T TaxID=2135446 RepID=UPI000D4CE9C5